MKKHNDQLSQFIQTTAISRFGTECKKEVEELRKSEDKEATLSDECVHEINALKPDILKLLETQTENMKKELLEKEAKEKTRKEKNDGGRRAVRRRRID